MEDFWPQQVLTKQLDYGLSQHKKSSNLLLVIQKKLTQLPFRRMGKRWRQEALMPQSEILDLVIELRSSTQGLGSYTAHFDHLQELTGRLAEKVIEQRRAAQ